MRIGELLTLSKVFLKEFPEPGAEGSFGSEERTEYFSDGFLFRRFLIKYTPAMMAASPRTPPTAETAMIQPLLAGPSGGFSSSGQQ